MAKGLSKSLVHLFVLTAAAALLVIFFQHWEIRSASAHVSTMSKKIDVRAGENLQLALNQARPGDVLLLEQGAEFVGNFVLPVNQSTGWITIRTSAQDNELPSDGHRISPDYSAKMARIISPNAEPALKTAMGAHGYQLIGIEATIASNVMLNYGLIVFGDGHETDPSQQPGDLVIDRCYIHGQPLADVARGVALNGSAIQLINSHVGEIHGIGFDTQAICGWNGPGPFSILNNYLEASGENVLFGGADPKIADLVPSDIDFRNNHCLKQVAWRDGIFSQPAGISAQPISSSGALAAATYYYRIAARGRAGASIVANSVASDEITVAVGPESNAVHLSWQQVANASEYRIYRTTDAPDASSRSWVNYNATSNSFDDVGTPPSSSGAPPATATRWTVKNLFELKNARRVTVDGNVFENNWLDAQSGFAILFTVRNQEGSAPWSVVEDVTFTANIVRHSGAGIMFIGSDNLHPSQQIKRVDVSRNLFDDIGGRQWGDNGRFVQITETVDTRIDHNTVFQTGNLLTAHGVPNQGFVFTNNIAPCNQYGVIGDGTASGSITLFQYFPNNAFKKNVIVGASQTQYPKKNFYPNQLDQVGFVDRSRGDYHLSISSQFKNAGTKGKDVGVDFDEIEMTATRAIQGIP